MNTKKAFFTKLAFSLFLVTVFSLVSANVKTTFVSYNICTQNLVSENNPDRSNSKQLLFSDNAEDAFKFLESEVELELELENFFPSEAFSKFSFLEFNIENNTLFSKNSTSKLNILLYDLFCNWKLHLS